MEQLARVIEEGRASAEFMAALVDHVRRVQAAQVAVEQLQRMTGEGVTEAANRRGCEAQSRCR